jgi:hypothetical protein
MTGTRFLLQNKTRKILRKKKIIQLQNAKSCRNVNNDCLVLEDFAFCHSWYSDVKDDFPAGSAAQNSYSGFIKEESFSKRLERLQNCVFA